MRDSSSADRVDDGERSAAAARECASGAGVLRFVGRTDNCGFAYAFWRRAYRKSAGSVRNRQVRTSKRIAPSGKQSLLKSSSRKRKVG